MTTKWTPPQYMTDAFLASLEPAERDFAIKNGNRLAPEGYVAVKFGDWQRMLALAYPDKLISQTRGECAMA